MAGKEQPNTPPCDVCKAIAERAIPRPPTVWRLCLEHRMIFILAVSVVDARIINPDKPIKVLDGTPIAFPRDPVTLIQSGSGMVVDDPAIKTVLMNQDGGESNGTEAEEVEGTDSHNPTD